MKQGSWYWVRIKGEWYPAMYDELSCGGWTNADTWENESEYAGRKVGNHV